MRYSRDSWLLRWLRETVFDPERQEGIICLFEPAVSMSPIWPRLWGLG
jgi:hypothetical protein